MDGSETGKYNVVYDGRTIKTNVTSITIEWSENFVNYGGGDIVKGTAMRSNGGAYTAEMGTTRNGRYQVTDLNKFEPYQERAFYVYAKNGSTMYLYIR